jgi:hypothetical protein
MPGERSDAVWTANDTTPGEVEKAIRKLVVDRHAENEGYVPARALNLVCVVDRDWSGEVANRLRQVGRYHGSRTVVCAIEPKRSTIDAMATIAADSEPDEHNPVALRETIVLTVGEQHVDKLQSIVDPLVVTDLATVVWSPHGHPEAVDSLLSCRQSGCSTRSPSPTRTRRSPAPPSCPSHATSSTSPGCAPRRGASASRPTTTRRRAPLLAGADRGRDRPARAPGRTSRHGCCSAGCPRLGLEPSPLVRQGRRRPRGKATQPAGRSGSSSSRSSMVRAAACRG